MHSKLGVQTVQPGIVRVVFLIHEGLFDLLSIIKAMQWSHNERSYLTLNMSFIKRKYELLIEKFQNFKISFKGLASLKIALKNKIIVVQENLLLNQK